LFLPERERERVSERAIGVFDSGVGGLTVFKEIAELLPGEELVYLGDTARVPYGTKSPPTVLRYALEAAAFLSDQRVKMLVVACNTASSVALTELEERFSLPVIGVIEPGARKAAALTRSRRVGVIGTEGTIRSGAYTRAIQAIDPAIEVFSMACPLFVPLVEEGWVDHPVTHLTAREYLTPLLHQGIDTLVLGCTHYPLLKGTLRAVLGAGVQLVDSAQETAALVSHLLRQRDQYRRSPAAPARIFVTDVPARFERVGGTFLGAVLPGVRQVQID
jgi:glutamate racemase